ncbi:hypothetical protein NGC53_00290 [Aerococcus viridans]|uniref:hypothetical protein n=1 Tax=Aerococcus viridans TaxID=1377 RepID=UPI002DB77329|nr:hypothetical protein [Aerococcus viridans]MEB7388261.1 hypothetical protein [Aerococcus viridans]
MTKNNCITEKCTFKQLTDIQRGMLEQMAKSGTYKERASLTISAIITSSILPPQAHGFIKKIVRTRMRGIIINILRLSLLPYLKI